MPKMNIIQFIKKEFHGDCFMNLKLIVHIHEEMTKCTVYNWNNVESGYKYHNPHLLYHILSDMFFFFIND